MNTTARVFALLIGSIACPAANALEPTECVFPAEQWGQIPLEPPPGTQSWPRQQETESGTIFEAYSELAEELDSTHLEPVTADVANRVRKYVVPGIGRLQILHKEGGVSCVQTCTGWLASEDRLITANHCLVGEVEKVGIHFGLVIDEDTPFIEVDPTPIATSDSINDPGLDFAILAVDESLVPAEVTPLRPALAEPQASQQLMEPRASQQLMIVGYPLGKSLYLVRQGCDAAASFPVTLEYNLRHKCHTTYGMSGAPVLDESSLAVIGVHVRGGHYDAISYNSAVTLSAIATVLPAGLLPFKFEGMSLAEFRTLRRIISSTPIGQRR